MTKGKLTTMEKIRECILRLRRNMSVRKIAQELAMHRNLIRQVKKISIQKGWLENDQVMPVYCQYTVSRSWKIMHNYIYYSVPYTLIGKRVEVCITRDAVRIFYKHQEVAFHIKGKEKWSYQKKKEHAPPLQEAVLNCNREGLLMKAEEIGKADCRELTEKMKNSII